MRGKSGNLCHRKNPHLNPLSEGEGEKRNSQREREREKEGEEGGTGFQPVA
jgi:hypothetical protein